jgi:hypothetical protein
LAQNGKKNISNKHEEREKWASLLELASGTTGEARALQGRRWGKVKKKMATWQRGVVSRRAYIFPPFSLCLAGWLYI